jgi:beta-phosphoglucomutase
MTSTPMNRTLRAVIFDLDGVLVNSPHERAWREALAGFADPAGFTTAFYQAHVAGRPRLEGARAALERLGGAAEQAAAYAGRKQAAIERLIAAGEFAAFPDAVRLVLALEQTALRRVLASSSKNADAMLARVVLPDGRRLLSLFDADVSGRDLPRGKPDPALFLLAAEAARVPPAQCVVVEDAPAGIAAARAGGMAALGIARLGDEAMLRAAGADLVLTSLDGLDVAALAGGALQARSSTEGDEASWPSRRHRIRRLDL